MSTESATHLIDSLDELQNKLSLLESEAQKLVALKGDMKAATAALSQTARDLTAVIAEIHKSALTMQSMSMPAILERIGRIEQQFDQRSQALQDLLDRDFAKLGDAIKDQVTKQLSALPSEMAPALASEFKHIFDATKSQITELSNGVVTREAAIDRELKQLHAVSREDFTKAVNDAAARTDQLITRAFSGMQTAGEAQRKLVVLCAILASIAVVTSIVSIFV